MARSVPARAAAAFSAATAVGAAVSLGLQVPGEPLGLRTPGTVPAQLALGLGSGLSAPWPMPVAAAVAARQGEAGRWPPAVLAALGWLVVCGVLAEPATWGRRSRHPLVWVTVVANLAAAGLLVDAGRRR